MGRSQPARLTGRSPLFLAHIRAATGTPVEQTNCHPFRHDRWLFMHNGFIDGYLDLRRELLLAVEPPQCKRFAHLVSSSRGFGPLGLRQQPLEARENSGGSTRST